MTDGDTIRQKLYDLVVGLEGRQTGSSSPELGNVILKAREAALWASQLPGEDAPDPPVVTAPDKADSAQSARPGPPVAADPSGPSPTPDPGPNPPAPAQGI